jgi:hypothetical protein
MPTFYEIHTLKLPLRYGLDDNVLRLLKAYDDYRSHNIDEAELGRELRLSSTARTILNDLIVRLAKIMADKPGEAKICFALLTDCTEMVRIADKPPSTAGCALLKRLPPELRTRIYDHYLSSVAGCLVHFPVKSTESTCRCARPVAVINQFHSIDLSLAYTSKAIRDEVLKRFYETRVSRGSSVSTIF